MMASCNGDDEKYSLEFNIQRQMEILQLLVDKEVMLPNGRSKAMPKGENTKQSTMSDIPEFEYHGYDCSFSKEYCKNVQLKSSTKTDKSNKKTASARGSVGIASADGGAGSADAAGLAGDASAAKLAGAACFDGATGLAGAADSNGASGFSGGTDSDGAAGSSVGTDSDGAAGFSSGSDSDGAAGFSGGTYSDGAAGFSGGTDSDGAAGFSGGTDSGCAASFSSAAGATGASDSDDAEDAACFDYENDPDFIKLMEQIDRSNNNPVLRIFRLLQSMHNYLKDEFPSTQPNFFPSEYVYDWPEKYTMPKTLSIRYQLQFAARKLNKFNIRLRRTLKRNENLDYMKFKECNDSLTSLEGLANELNAIKDLELRHDDYEFKTDAMKALASTVEMLIQRINDQIREAHLFITVFNWEMDLEHRQSQTMIKERQKTLDYAMEMIAKSRDNVLKKQDPEYQAALKAKYKLPERFNLDHLSERVAKYDDVWDEMLANPGKFYINDNIPPEGLLPKSEQMAETPEKKSVPVPATQLYDNQESINQLSSENIKLPKEVPIDCVNQLNNTERPLKPTHRFG